MPTRARRLVRAATVAAIVVAVAATAVSGYQGQGPLAPLWVTETRLAPVAVGGLGEGGDPRALVIAVPWTREGFCDGQFDVEVTETPAEIRLGTVVSREAPGTLCAGLGTVDDQAWFTVELAAPRGTRPVIRAGDGAVLPAHR